MFYYFSSFCDLHKDGIALFMSFSFCVPFYLSVSISHTFSPLSLSLSITIYLILSYISDHLPIW